MGIWNQQFSSAGFDEMLSEIGADPSEALGLVRSWVSTTLGWKPNLRHYQSSWGWAEGYEGDKGSLRGVYLIPEPGRVRVAMSFDRTGLGALEGSDLPKGLLGEVRDGMCVLSMVWAECSVQTRGDADGVCGLLGLLCG